MITQEKHVDILLVEDNPDDAMLTLRAFKQRDMGDRVFHVIDGDEALDFIFATNMYGEWALMTAPKLILLDLKLPKLDGLEVLKAIRSDVRTKAIPVVILTSSKEQQDIIEGYKSGASAFIQKPVEFEHFRRTIKEIGTFWLVVNQSPPAEVFEPSSQKQASA